MAVEERMSKCIVYNLTTLTQVIKPNDFLVDVLTEGLFIKTNTNAFIQVTYYLFNILDQKEFKKKFYWPIIDKKTESSYRGNSVEFINMIINRYNINQEKIKLVSVVHSSGKKFMSLILDLIGVAIKEVMKRKKYDQGVSLNMEKASEIVDTISEIGQDIISSVKTDSKTIQDRIQEIQEIINTIYPSEKNLISFEEFIANWHALNKTRLEQLNENNVKVREVFSRTKLLQEKVRKKLSKKEFKVVQPSSDEIKELAEFYQQVDAPVDKQLNIVSLLLYLESCLPIIQNYIKNFSYDEFEINAEEMKVVKNKLVELQHFEPLIKRMQEKEMELKEKIAKMNREKEENELLMADDGSKTLHDEKLFKEVQEREAMRSLLSPKHHFDVSRNSMNIVIPKRNHIVFATGNDGIDSNEHSLSTLNHTKLYRPLSDSKLNKSREMVPPKPNNPPPSRRRRRDPMQLLEQATSSTNKKHDLNSTTQDGGANIIKSTSTPFSSTMLSPDLINYQNFSMISNISSVCQTPMSSIGHYQLKNVASENYQSQHYTQFQAISKPDVLSSNNMDNIPLQNENKKMKNDPVVSLQNAFDAIHIGDGKILSDLNSPITPKIKVTDDTLYESKNSTENTISEKENFGSEIDETVLLARKQGCEENLFNISDSVLVED